MFSTEDTIVAVATPAGRGGIGVVRLSGPGAHAIARGLVGRDQPLRPRYATLARVRSAVPTGGRANGTNGTAREGAFDEVICTWFPAPHSYTGEDVVEVSAHGSPVVLARIVDEATRAGARLARPGEFTLRAYLTGRLDLPQAEAVADLVDAVTPAQARLAFDQLEGTLSSAIHVFEQRVFELVTRLEASLDFPDEGYHFIDPAALAQALASLAAGVATLLSGAGAGRVLREGALAVIVGPPNAGKSTLFNALLGAPRAIVTALPGTTRDLLTEPLDIGGVPVTIVDTAGLREGRDEVERLGVARAREAAGAAQVRLVVLDRSVALRPEDATLLEQDTRSATVAVATKADLPAAWDATAVGCAHGTTITEISAHLGHGLDELRQRLREALVEGSREQRDLPRISNVRHIRLLERAAEAISRAREAEARGASEEFVLADLRDVETALAEVSGTRQPSATLDAIFERFCIGK